MGLCVCEGVCRFPIAVDRTMESGSKQHCRLIFYLCETFFQITGNGTGPYPVPGKHC